MDVASTQVEHPAPLALGDLASLEDRPRVLGLRRPGRRVDVLLRDLLHLPVERGRHPVAAGIDLRAVVRRVGAQDLGEGFPHLPHEVGSPPGRGDLRLDDRRLALGGLVLGGRVPVTGQRAARLHEIEDVVAADDDLARGRDPQLHLRAFDGVGRGRFGSGRRVRAGGRVGARNGFVEAELLGVPEQVELGRRLGDGGEDGVLGEGQLLQRLAEVALGRGLHAVAVVAVEVVVEVRRDDLALAVLAGIRLRQADRLDDLLDLPLVGRKLEGLGRQQPVADQLLGDGGRPARSAGNGVEAGADDADRVESRVDPEVLVLDRRRRIEHLVRELVERDDLAAERSEASQLHLAGPVVDDRLLLEVDVREGGLGVREPLRVVVVRGDREQGSSSCREQAEEQQDDGDGDEDAASPTSAAPLGTATVGASVTLPPRESRLHLSPQDSIGVVNERSSPSSRFETTSSAAL